MSNNIEVMGCEIWTGLRTMWNEFRDFRFEVRKSQIPWHGR